MVKKQNGSNSQQKENSYGVCTYYQNFGDAIAAAWDIFVRDSKGIEVDMRECWARLVEENWIKDFCAVAAIEVKDEIFNS